MSLKISSRSFTLYYPQLKLSCIYIGLKLSLNIHFRAVLWRFISVELVTFFKKSFSLFFVIYLWDSDEINYKVGTIIKQTLLEVSLKTRGESTERCKGDGIWKEVTGS